MSLARAGPELLSSASDNDPTNVGTAAVVGAQSGYQLAWVALLVAPLLGVVQTIALHVATVARSDLQALALRRYGRLVAGIFLFSVVAVNVVTIAADLQAGAVGLGLLVHADSRWLVLPLGVCLLGLLLIGRYDEVVAVLRFLLLGFLAFAAAAVLARPSWTSLLRGTFVPTLNLHREVVAGALAILGTTLTSYVYVWETIQRGVEEPLSGFGEPLDPRALGGAFRHARFATIVGSAFTAGLFWCMLVVSAATLGRHHESVANVQIAAQELRPLAGSLSADLFAVGLVVSAIVALPVLMATTAYMVGAEFDWRRGLTESVSKARGFYGVIAGSIGLAVIVTLANVSLFSMLVAASVLGGIGTPIGLVILLRVARDPEMMGERPISRRLAVSGWVVTAAVSALGLMFLVLAATGSLL